MKPKNLWIPRLRRISIRHLMAATVLVASPLLATSLSKLPLEEARVQDETHRIVGKLQDKEAFIYWTQKPADSPCTSVNAAYFHPLTTPSGWVVTDLAPDDHLHHRGVFHTWLEVRNAQGEGDFWGWGKYAKLEERRIESLPTTSTYTGPDGLGFQVQNAWMAGEARLLKETLESVMLPQLNTHVYDLSYRFEVQSETVLGQHAFSGFTVRLRKDFPMVAYDASGVVHLPAPHHLKPESNWPDRDWYAFEFQLPEGKKAGVAVIQKAQRPKTLWHNLTKIGMINPCILAQGPVIFQPDAPLVLEYRVVTFDGPVPFETLKTLTQAFQAE